MKHVGGNLFIIAFGSAHVAVFGKGIGKKILNRAPPLNLGLVKCLKNIFLRTMKMIRACIALFLTGVFALTNSCSNDFEVNSDWEQIGIVYGLIDKDDSIQYFKITKAYLNNENSAVQIASIEDSLYFDEEDLKVTLGYNDVETELFRVKIDQKDSGVFSYPVTYAYRTPDNYRIGPGRTYILRIKDERTGYEMRAETEIVKSGSIIDPFSSLEQLSITNCDSEDNFKFYLRRAMKILSGRDARFYDFDIIFHYKEFEISTGDSTEHEVVWPIARFLRTQTDNGGQEIGISYDGEKLYEVIGDNIEVKQGVERVAGNVEFVFYSGGQEIFDYINVNRPSIGIVQKRPEYSNVDNGLGILSSRNTQRVSLPLDKCSLKHLSDGEYTKDLGFVR